MSGPSLPVEDSPVGLRVDFAGSLSCPLAHPDVFQRIVRFTPVHILLVGMLPTVVGLHSWHCLYVLSVTAAGSLLPRLSPHLRPVWCSMSLLILVLVGYTVLPDAERGEVKHLADPDICSLQW